MSGKSALSAQISRQTMFVAATNQLVADFADLASKVYSVKNTVDFVAGDLSNFITDLDESDASRTAIEIYMKAAEHEVATLALDAS